MEPTNGPSRSTRLALAVRSSPLLGHLPDEDLTAALSIAKVVHGGRGAILARSDSDAVLVLVLLQGAAVASVFSHEAGEVMVDLLGPGGTTGVAVVLGRPDGGVDVTALVPCDALTFAGAACRDLIAERPALALATMRLLAHDVSTWTQQAVRFASTSTAERIVDRIVELVDRWGVAEPDGTMRITVPLTQERLASWANSSRESTAKVLHDLRRAGAIRTGRQEITILDDDLLRARRSPNDGSPDDVLRTLLRSIG